MAQAVFMHDTRIKKVNAYYPNFLLRGLWTRQQPAIQSRFVPRIRPGSVMIPWPKSDHL